ncbi:MAG: phage tail protein [Elusimicrobia bacterium]|nr:phage tail protein [Elusimicrobiota bacterium]
MTIAFDGIPSNIRKPGRYIEFNTRLAGAGLPSGDRKLLLIGQKTSAGSKAVEVPVRVYSETEAITYFGAGSVAHLMVKAAFKANPYANITVIAPADGSQAVAATSGSPCVGTATGPGLLTFKIGNVTTEVPIASGDTATVIMTALKAALDKYVDLPVIVTMDIQHNLVLTARNTGLLSNTIGLSAESTAPGATVTVQAMSGGLVDPDIANCLTAVHATRYHRIVCAYNSSTALGKLKTHMELVSGPLEQHPGIGVYAYIGAVADALTLALNYNTSGRMQCALLKGGISLSWEQAAAMGAVEISVSDPALPLNGLPLTGIAAPATADRLTRAEQESCLAAGVTPLEVNASEEVTIVRSITTYTTNSAGVASSALLDTTTVDSLDYIREAAATRIGLRFPQSKLNARVAKSVRTELYSMLKDAEELEIVQNVDANADALIVEPDANIAGRLNCVIPAAVVPGLHVFAARIDLIL